VNEPGAPSITTDETGAVSEYTLTDNTNGVDTSTLNTDINTGFVPFSPNKSGFEINMKFVDNDITGQTGITAFNCFTKVSNRYYGFSLQWYGNSNGKRNVWWVCVYNRTARMYGNNTMTKALYVGPYHTTLTTRITYQNDVLTVYADDGTSSSFTYDAGNVLQNAELYLGGNSIDSYHNADVQILEFSVKNI
jgi:hypothetical protein